jgi:uncharacterized protein YndB with AHSA1/START domain
MARFLISSFSQAPPETVFDVLTDHRGYVKLTPLRSAELEREGEPSPNGVGAIRVLRAPGIRIREEVLEFERPTRFVYRLLSGLPVRDHQGTVSLVAEGGGTRITYEVETTPTIPLAGFAVVGGIRTGIGRLVKAVVKESQRRTAATPPT